MKDRDMASNHKDIDRIVQSCLQAMEYDGESLNAVIARYPDLEASIRPPLEAALWLNRVKYSVDPTPEFVSGARKRLLAQIQQRHVASAPSKKFSLRDFIANLERRQLALQFAFALLLIVFLVAGTGSIALASRNALPGDSLYNVKLAQEQVRLSLSFTEMGDARLHAQFAQERLAEIQRLVLESRFEYLDQAVAAYEREVAQVIELTRQVAHEDGPEAVAFVSQMDEILSSQEVFLNTLSEQVPPQGEASILMALDRAEEGLFELAVIRNQLTPTEVPTATPTPTPSRTPSSEPPTPSPSASDLPGPAFGVTPTATVGPALIQTSSPSTTPAPTQVSAPVQPPTQIPTSTPEPTKEKVKPKPTNTHRPTSRPTNPNRPTQNTDK